MVGFLGQNYVTPYNNLVNMIVLLEYFSTSISVYVWNKLYASFYLKNIMNILLFKNLNKVWFIKLLRGIVGPLSFSFSNQDYVCF
jgi:hypothetical protein